MVCDGACFPVAWINTMSKSKLGRKGFLSDNSSSLRAVRVGWGGGGGGGGGPEELKQNTREAPQKKAALSSSQVTFLTQQKPPTQDWVLPHK